MITKPQVRVDPSYMYLTSIARVLGMSMDAQSCLVAIALGHPADQRPKQLIKALKDLFEEELGVDIPEADHLNLMPGLDDEAS